MSTMNPPPDRRQGDRRQNAPGSAPGAAPELIGVPGVRTPDQSSPLPPDLGAAPQGEQVRPFRLANRQQIDEMWTEVARSLADETRRGVGGAPGVGAGAAGEAPMSNEDWWEEGIPDDPSIAVSEGGSPAAPFEDELVGTVAPGQDGVPAGLQTNAARGAAAARRILGFDGTIGGIGERSTKSDHPNGNAIDLMTGDNLQQGWDMARWYHENRDRLGVTYIIFNGKIASPRDGWQWRDYRHPGGRTDATAMHHDHVHISFRGDG